MAKLKLSDKEQVDIYVSKLEPQFAKTVETIRQIILHTDKEIS